MQKEINIEDIEDLIVEEDNDRNGAEIKKNLNEEFDRNVERRFLDIKIDDELKKEERDDMK